MSVHGSDDSSNEARSTASPRFRIGDPVRVKLHFPPGHVRTPFYCRGKHGVVERICGAYRNPEKLAYGDAAAEEVTLYRVSFPQSELWDDYDGLPQDTAEIELFEHWLEQD